MNNIFKTKNEVEIDSNFKLQTDTFSGICLVKSFPAQKENKTGEKVDYIATEKFYYNTVAQALEKYMELKQIILPSIVEMLEVQKEVAEVLRDFKNKFKNL